MDFSQDGRYLVSSAEDFTVRIWRISDGRLIETIDEGMAQVNRVAFAPDSYVQEHGQAIAWTEDDGTVRLRSLNGGWLFTMKETSFSATSLAFSHDGKWLVVGYADGTIRVWNTEDGTLLQALKSHTQKVSSVVFSPDGKWLASALARQHPASLADRRRQDSKYPGVDPEWARWTSQQRKLLAQQQHAGIWIGRWQYLPVGNSPYHRYRQLGAGNLGGHSPQDHRSIHRSGDQQFSIW